MTIYTASEEQVAKAVRPAVDRIFDHFDELTRAQALQGLVDALRDLGVPVLVDDTPGRIPELEPARRLAQYWLEAGRNAATWEHGIIGVEASANVWKNAAYGMADQLLEIQTKAGAVPRSRYDALNADWLAAKAEVEKKQALLNRVGQLLQEHRDTSAVVDALNADAKARAAATLSRPG